MFELFEKVKIKSKNIIGTIVDISGESENFNYVVEDDTKREVPDGPGGIFPIFDCKEDDLEKI